MPKIKDIKVENINDILDYGCNLEQEKSIIIQKTFHSMKA